MRTLLLALAGLGVAPAAPPARAGDSPRHDIAVDARGPLALVEITRVLPAPEGPGAAEAMLDLALPEGSALAGVEVRDRGRWRAVEAAASTAAADVYRDASTARGVIPAVEPFDDSADYRLRIQRGQVARGGEPPAVRYRFSTIPVFSNGRFRVRFPSAPERMAVPADVTVTLQAALDVDIAGTRTATTSAGVAKARGRASTRSGWEVSWAPRDPVPAAAAPTLDARVVIAPLSPTETALAYSIRSRAARPAGGPTSVLLLIDRSRSVGLPGLSAEHDLARRVLEALPPSTRFDALFFDRSSKRLFPMSRPATREAIGALEGEMVPVRMQNGTDLAAALRDAGALLRREQSTFGPRTLLLVLTDGALPANQDGAALDRALGALPDLGLSVAAFIVRPPDDDPVGREARQALHDFAASRHGIARVLRTTEVADAVTAALADLDRGGDFAPLRVKVDGKPTTLAPSLAPDTELSGVVSITGKPPRVVEIEVAAHGKRITLPARAARVRGDWLRSRTAAAPRPEKARMLVSPSLLALVEPIARSGPEPEPVVKGSMDRLVMRNVLSLAYMPRARACYLARTGATAASRDLTGKVRLAIDVVRGEVERAAIESSTLHRADVELCLREGAFEIEVPRVVRNDAPVTAILNLVFRPQTPEKKRGNDLGAVGDQIDLIIESAQRRDEETAQATTAPAPPPSAENAKPPSPTPTR
jgi:VWA domain-containing protein